MTPQALAYMMLIETRVSLGNRAGRERGRKARSRKVDDAAYRLWCKMAQRERDVFLGGLYSLDDGERLDEYA